MNTVEIQDYSDKSFVVIGEATEAIKDQLSEANGKWNTKLSCGPGWVFSKKHKETVEALLKKKDVMKKIKEFVPRKGKKPVESKNNDADEVDVSVVSSQIVDLFKGMTVEARLGFLNTVLEFVRNVKPVSSAPTKPAKVVEPEEDEEPEEEDPAEVEPPKAGKKKVVTKPVTTSVKTSTTKPVKPTPKPVKPEETEEEPEEENDDDDPKEKPEENDDEENPPAKIGRTKVPHLVISKAESDESEDSPRPAKPASKPKPVASKPSLKSPPGKKLVAQMDADDDDDTADLLQDEDSDVEQPAKSYLVGKNKAK